MPDNPTQEQRDNQPDDGIALALSGGGYRAMVFHVGSILRINEAGILHKLKRVSSVSGGSITAGVLGLNWKRLTFQKRPSGAMVAANLDEHLVQPIRKMAGRTIDVWAIGLGPLTPRMTIADYVARNYAQYLFGEATLQDLPSDSAGPRFVINATNVQTGALARFSKPLAADYQVGQIPNPKFPMAQVVAASSAFPPVLSPMTLDVNPGDFKRDPEAPLQKRPFNDVWVLSDGGVYDNLGLETIFKRYRTLLVSDGGAKIAPEGAPASNWAEHSKRVLDIIDNQVRSLRKRQLIDAYKNETRDGAYWGIRTNIDDYNISPTPRAPHARTLQLAEVPTRLKAMATDLQNQLMNWGYAVTDAALRAHCANLLPSDLPPPNFPFPGGVG